MHHDLENSGVSIGSIAVAVPTFGRETLARAIRSVVAQTIKPAVILITKDGTFELDGEAQAAIAQARSNGIEVLTLENGKVGVQRARNAAIHATSCHFITFLDDDDEFLPDRLELFSNSWDSSISLLFSDDVSVNERGRRVKSAHPPVVDEKMIYLDNYIGNQAFTLTARLIGVGGYDVSLPAAQDYDLWIRLIRRYGAARRVDGATIIRYLGSDSITRDTKRRGTGYRRNYFKHRRQESREIRAWKMLYLRCHLDRRLLPSLILAVLFGSLPVAIKKHALLLTLGNLRRRFKS